MWITFVVCRFLEYSLASRHTSGTWGKFMTCSTASLGSTPSSSMRATAVSTGSDTLVLPRELHHRARRCHALGDLRHRPEHLLQGTRPRPLVADRAVARQGHKARRHDVPGAAQPRQRRGLRARRCASRISAQRATTAASALFISLRPSTIARRDVEHEVLERAGISTPVTSVEVFTRKHDDAEEPLHAPRQLLVFDAAKIAVGEPCISSTANAGPESTASGWSRPNPFGPTGAARVPTSRPLERHSRGVAGSMWSFAPAKNAVRALHGHGVDDEVRASATEGSVVARTIGGARTREALSVRGVRVVDGVRVLLRAHEDHDIQTLRLVAREERGHGGPEAARRPSRLPSSSLPPTASFNRSFWCRREPQRLFCPSSPSPPRARHRRCPPGTACTRCHPPRHRACRGRCHTIAARRVSALGGRRRARWRATIAAIERRWIAARRVGRWWWRVARARHESRRSRCWRCRS